MLLSQLTKNKTINQHYLPKLQFKFKTGKYVEQLIFIIK